MKNKKHDITNAAVSCRCVLRWRVCVATVRTGFLQMLVEPTQQQLLRREVLKIAEFLTISEKADKERAILELHLNNLPNQTQDERFLACHQIKRTNFNH